MSNNNNKVVSLLNTNDAKKLIAEMVKDTNLVKFTNHALERMDERGITATQVLKVLERGDFEEVPWYDPIKGDYKFTKTGIAAGDLITVAGAIIEKDPITHSWVLVITTY